VLYPSWLAFRADWLKFTLSYCLLLGCPAGPAAVAEVISPKRLAAGATNGWAVWAGIPGGIPHVATVFTNLTGIDNTGKSDVTAAIQLALDACPSNQVVKLPAGAFKYNGQLRFERDGVVLRGAGVRETVLFADAVAPGASHMFVRNNAHDEGFANVPKYNLRGDYAGGDSNLTTTTPHDFAPGDFVWIDQKTNHIGATGYFPHIINIHSSPDGYDCGGQCGSWPLSGRDARPYGEMTRVVAVESNGGGIGKLVIQPPLLGWFAASNAPQIMKMTGIVQRCGIESLTITNTAHATNSYTLQISGTYQFWLTNVELRCSTKRHVYFINSLQTHIQQTDLKEGRYPGSAFDNSPIYGPDSAYMIFAGYGASCYRIVDNIFSHCHFALAHEGASAGGVIAYNFVTNVQFNNAFSVQPAGGYHAAHPHQHLWEGNIFANGKFMADGIWGSGGDSTLFRNRISPGQTNAGVKLEQYHHCIDVWARQHYWNIVGNVVGQTNWHNYLDHPDGGSVQDGGGKLSCQRFGIRDANTRHYDDQDPWVTNTMILKENYYFVKTERSRDYENGIPPDQKTGTNLPASYAFSAKPTWAGNLPWPMIGPDVSLHATNPAMLRFYGITNYLPSTAAAPGR
jgi:hypothetical protein